VGLPLLCPACGAPDRDGERFCAQCGAELAARPAVPPPAPGRSEPAPDPRAYTRKLLIERSGLERLRGHADRTARDLAEARHLFAEMAVTGWGDYARSIKP